MYMLYRKFRRRYRNGIEGRSKPVIKLIVGRTICVEYLYKVKGTIFCSSVVYYKINFPLAAIFYTMDLTSNESPMMHRPPQVPSRKVSVRFAPIVQFQPFSFLPELLLQLILSYLTPSELGRVSVVDRQMNREAATVAEFCALKILREVFASDYPLVLQRLLSSQPNISYKKFLNDLRKRRVLVLNGTSKHSSMFDINSNKWAPCSIAMTQHRAAFSSVWFRGELVVISGNVPGTLSSSTLYIQSFPYSDHLLLFQSSDVATGTVEKYNPFTDAWTSLPPLPQRLRYASGAVLHNQLYILGGFNKTSGAPSNAVYRYETNDHLAEGAAMAGGGYWNLVDIPLPSGRYTHAAVGFDGKIWVAGGFPKPTSVQVYDPLLGDWSEAPPMVIRRAQFKLLVVNGELYAVGGDDAMTNRTTIEKFDRRSQSWSVVTTLKEQRLMLSSSVAGSKIYIFGGMVSSTKALDSWDAYDVRTGTWESDLHLAENDVDDGVFDDEGEYFVGYDLDDDVDIDMEMAVHNSPSALNARSSPSERFSPSIAMPVHGGGRSSVSPAVLSSSCSSTPMFTRSFISPSMFDTPAPSVASCSSSAMIGMTSSEETTPSPPSGGLRRCTSSSGNLGQISLAVPSSLKRSLSGTLGGNTPLRQLNGSFLRHSPSPSSESPAVALASPSPIRCKVFSPAPVVDEDGGQQGHQPKRLKRRVKRAAASAPRDRTMPFSHAFGCAITIPAICLYSS